MTKPGVALPPNDLRHYIVRFPHAPAGFRLRRASRMMRGLSPHDPSEEALVSDARILVILGSVTPPGRMHRAVHGSAQRATGAGFGTVEVLDLADVRLGFAGAPPIEGDELPSVIERVRAADAVIFASPVYRGSFSGVLKNLLDVLPIDTLEGKPAGLVAMGNTRDHALGVERHLRDVLAWFGMLPAPTSVFFSAADFEAGVLQPNPSADLDTLVVVVAQLVDATRGMGRAFPLRPAATREE